MFTRQRSSTEADCNAQGLPSGSITLFILYASWRLQTPPAGTSMVARELVVGEIGKPVAKLAG